jgi:hypothetical protein
VKIAQLGKKGDKIMRTIEHRVKGTENDWLVAQLDYLLGGVKKRGYYVYIRRITRSNGMYSYDLMSGRKILLKEVKRQSKKAEAEAEQIMNDNYRRYFEMVYPGVEYSEGCTIR